VTIPRSSARASGFTAFRTNMGIIRSASRYSTRSGKAIVLPPRLPRRGGRKERLKLPSGQNAHLRTGIEKETEGVSLVSTRHRPPQFPLPPYTIRVASQFPASDSAFVAVLAQTSTPGFGGTFGQSVPAATAADLIRNGSERSILSVREDGSFRTNLIPANATEAVLAVDVRLVGGDGVTLGTKT
jgi:hypothetical protein